MQALAHSTCGGTRRARAVRSTDAPPSCRRHHRDHRRFHAGGPGIRRRKAHRADGWTGVVGACTECPAPSRIPRDRQRTHVRDPSGVVTGGTNVPDVRSTNGPALGTADQGALPWVLQVPSVPRNAAHLTGRTDEDVSAPRSLASGEMNNPLRIRQRRNGARP